MGSLSNTIKPETLFDKAHKVANLYGFTPTDEMIKEHRSTKRTKITTHNKPEKKDLHHLSLLLKFYFERSLHIGEHKPIFTYHSNIDKNTKSAITRSKKQSDAYFTLTVIGISEPYAEALLLSCTSHIFRNLKSKKHRIRINSMGTAKDSKIYFSKLNKTIRKVQKNINPECQKLLKEGKIREAHPLLHSNEHTGVAEYITPTLRLLSEKARQHFEQVIEYLEAHQLPYELAPEIIETTQHGIHTAFEVQDEESPLYARGARYDTLPYFVHRRRTPVTSLTITLPKKQADGTHESKTNKKKPKAFFFHAGERARLQSLSIISKLYDANIPVAHQLHHIRVADQLNKDARSYPYIIVFGQEEVKNNIIRIRKTDTHASRTVSINEKNLQTAKQFMSR